MLSLNRNKLWGGIKTIDIKKGSHTSQLYRWVVPVPPLHKDNMDYSKKLKEIRMRLNITQEDLAHILKCTVKTVSFIETGRTKKPCKALKANIDREYEKTTKKKE